MQQIASKKIYTFCVLALMMMFLQIGCRKSDLRLPENNKYREQFFNVPEQQPKIIYKIVEWIKEDDAKNHVVDAIAREGMPVWDRHIIETTGNKMTIKIPLMTDSTSSIDNYILVQTTRESVNMNLIRGRFYHRYATNYNLSSKTIILDLMHLNNRTFGSMKFVVEDLKSLSLDKVTNLHAPILIDYSPAGNKVFSNNATASSVNGPVISSNLMEAPCSRTVTFNMCNGGIINSGPLNCGNIKVVYSNPCTPTPPQLPPSPPSGSDPYSNYPWDYVPGGQPGVTVAYPTSCGVGISPATCEAFKVPVKKYIVGTVSSEKETSPAFQDGSAFDWWDKNKSVPGLTINPQPRPKFDLFVSKYPKVQDANGLWKDKSPYDLAYQIKGDLLFKYSSGDFRNGCAVRVSYALNYSGVVIPNIPGQTWRGFDNKYYFYTAAHLYNWLVKTFGEPDVALNTFDGSPDGTKFLDKLRAGGIVNKGIYLMKPFDYGSFEATGHATYFGGFDVFNNKGYFPAAAWIYVWRLPQQ